MPTEPDAAVASSLPHSLSGTERSAARYLLAISDLSGPADERVTTGELQASLNVTPASVTEMVSKLDDRGLVAHEKYQGVTLTNHGEALATEAARRVCAVSTFFDSVLDLPVDGETAFDIGVALPRAGVFRLRELGDSACLDHCPDAEDEPERCTA